MATDPAGNVYVAQTASNRIQKFDGNGNFITQWGSLGSGNGQFKGPDGIATDAVGNVYVVDKNNGRIQKFTSGGTYMTQWGSLGDGNGQFRWDFTPAGIAVDAAGNVYVTNWTNDNAVHRVQKFSGAGVAPSHGAPSYLLQWGSAGSGNSQFNQAEDAAVGPSGSVYVVDAGNHRIEKFDAAGNYVTSWGSFGTSNGQFNGPFGVAVGANDTVYVSEFSGNRIQKFTSSGGFVTKWGTNGSGNAQFINPEGLAVDAAGNVYVVDNGNNRIQKFDRSGNYLTQWGFLGSGNGQFNGPNHVAADAAGNIFVSDYLNFRVEKFTSSGAYVTQWSNGAPFGLAVDAGGNVYVSQAGGHSVQEFTSNGTYLAQWGSAGSGNGQFLNTPFGVAVDAPGNIYVVDQGNSRVEKFVAPPLVALVSDVGNDQGGHARLRIVRSSADAPGVGATVTGYEIYRRVEPIPGAMGAKRTVGETSAGVPVGSPGALLAGWEQVGTISARGDAEYDAVVPTLANATAASVFYTAFLVRAITPDPLTHYDSGAEYGYSVDNLSPPSPSSFTANYVASATHLHWGVSPASDFATFRLYRGASANFTPGPGNLLTATTDTAFVDVGPAGSWYKLSAVDANGNEGPLATLGPAQTTAVSAEAPLALALEAVRPNPASGRHLTVRFTLPVAAAARLELLDVAGRRVAERDVGALGAGAHAVDLAEGARVSPGLYFVRLRQGTGEQVRRVTVLEP